MFGSSLNGFDARTVHPGIRAVGVKSTCEGLPAPEIIEDLQSALEELQAISGDLAQTPEVNERRTQAR